MIKQLSALSSTYQRSLTQSGVAVMNKTIGASKKTISTPQRLGESIHKTTAFMDFMNGYFDGDIWVIPQSRSYDFETIITPKNFTFSIYNSGDTATNLISILPSNDDGIVLSGLTAPYTFTPRQEKQVTITAQPQGDIQLAAKYLFVFDNQILAFSLTGVRAVILSVRPNDDYEESESFATDIFTAQNGKETRMSISPRAKKSVSYSVTTKTEQDTLIMQELIAYALKYYCLQPLWFSATFAASTLVSNTITCDTTDRDFSIGGFVMVRASSTDYQFAKVVSISASAIVIDKAISIIKGAEVIPLLKVTPDSSNGYGFTTHNVGSFKLTMKELV